MHRAAVDGCGRRRRWDRHDLLASDRTGHGEPLLLLHGIGSTRDDFSALLPRLAEHFGNSLGARIAIELAVRHRTRSVVAISPSGLGLPAERVHQGILMATARTLTRTLRPLLGTLASTPAGRTALLAGMRARPWEASEREALTMRSGFAHATGFWSMLWWAVLQDVPSRLHRVDCPVTLAQGAVDVVGAGQTPRYLPLIPGSRFQLLPGAGHAPQSDAADTILALVGQTAARADSLMSGPRAQAE
jgi:pimeloyl-ACP methyl ester carboxylesterase